MHGAEKSDLAIVAVKPANDSGQPDAEWVEPRAGAKGNVEQQRTRRAQDRVSVSQALTAYGKLQGKGSRNGSSRCSTMSISQCYGRRSMPSGGTLPPERTD
jgi:hypothetical protein